MSKAPHEQAVARSLLQDRIIFWVGIGFVLVVPSLIGLYAPNSSVAWIALVSGAFVTMMSKFDSLAEFSLGPLRARMREVVDQATATIAQLQNLAVSITSAFLEHLIASSFMGVMSNDRRFKMRNELITELKLLGANDKQLQRAEAKWNDGVGLIYHRIISTQITDENKQNPTHNHNELVAELQKLPDFENLRSSTPESYEQFARSHGLLKPSVQSWVDDYRHFQKTGEIRRREEFMKG